MSGKEAVTDDVPVRMMQNVPVMVEFSGRFKFSMVHTRETPRREGERSIEARER